MLKISNFSVTNVEGKKYLNAVMISPRTGFERKYSVYNKTMSQEELIAKAKENKADFISKLEVSESGERPYLSYYPEGLHEEEKF